MTAALVRPLSPSARGGLTSVVAIGWRLPSRYAGQVLALALVILAVAEVYVVVQVAHAVGILATLALLVVVSIAGAWLVKREGLGVWRRARVRVNAGEVPGRELTDGLMILIGGVLLMVPGFVTDFLAILLLLPPVRAVARAMAVRRMARRVAVVSTITSVRRGRGDVIDLESTEETPHERGQIGPPRRTQP